ncbi:DUF1697 domain-containing protein [Heyndrickxia acidicola]|uniref:DUF1697 domain-containing protein n=1 Tax=Heyndrickxia acidicola TaxID=209389 RepID=A0ABU6MR46_9BACI|nr:DUF1697 domain-containing protein [Heyndrickxia acidicola]MED1205697.1 DUF1697 domain-containing protein [Heyndrickxia acidicola]
MKNVYIALLRGINVGGKNKIKMEELRNVFESLGLQKVKTYIQSGNVLFESYENESSLCQLLESEIAAAFGFSVSVMLRTSEEMVQIINGCPYRPDELQEGESIHVSFLSKVPSKEAADKVLAYNNDAEACQIKGREVYLFFRKSIRDSKLANQLHKLDVPSTLRNWNTASKLAGMANVIQ